MTTQNSSSVYLGLSGVVLPVPKYQFPPEHQNASRLAYYSTIFNSIEINTSFYKIPMKKTLDRWAGSVGSDFTFTFKLFREVTHSKGLGFSNSYVDEFIQTLASIGEKRGCLLVQFPPSLTSENLAQLEYLLQAIQNADEENRWRIAVEFRHKGWYNHDAYDLLEYYGATLVLHDIPASATSLNQVSSDVVYLRFHGPTGNYRGSYTDAHLLEYAGYVQEWIAEKKTVYIYFNNTAGDAFNNCRTMQRFLSKAI